MRYVKLSKVYPNAILAVPVTDNDGNITLRANTKLTECLLQELRSSGIKEVCIFDDTESLIDYNDTISLEIRINAINALRTYNLDKCLYVANQITNDILNRNCNSIAANVRRLITFDNYTFNHSVDVAVYAAMVGIGLGYELNRLKELTTAGLLHDVGKIFVSKDILFKQGVLNKQEFDIVKRHSVLGYELIKYKDELSPNIKLAILQHHESEDGSGYPCGLIGSNISEFAKIVHVCDVFDALISRRCYKDPINPSDAVKYITANTNVMFDRRIVDSFLHTIDIYSIGMKVKLNDGRVATVKERTEDKFKPIVEVDNSTISLGDTDLSIEEIV